MPGMRVLKSTQNTLYTWIYFNPLTTDHKRTSFAIPVITKFCYSRCHYICFWEAQYPQCLAYSSTSVSVNIAFISSNTIKYMCTVHLLVHVHWVSTTGSTVHLYCEVRSYIVWVNFHLHEMGRKYLSEPKSGNIQTFRSPPRGLTQWLMISIIQNVSTFWPWEGRCFFL